MLNIPTLLRAYDLTIDNSIVMCSGILNALHLRESHDIDLVVDEDTFQRLKNCGDFEIKHYGNNEMLTNEIFEICKIWEIEEWKKILRLDDFKEDSVIIDNVRYISLEFLLKYKKLLITNNKPREKDFKDIEIIDKYLLEILEQNPNGIHWSELLKMIQTSFPTFHPKTINGCIWKLIDKYPDEVYKPEKGLFRLVKYK